MEAHIIVSYSIFPYLVLESGPAQSTIALLKDSSKAGDLTCSTRATVLGNFWSYIRAVEMGQFPFGCFSNTQVFYRLRTITAFRYSSGITMWQITCHSSYADTSGGHHFLINTSSFMK